MSEINKEYIESRVSDWRNRITNIFSLVKNYCSNYPQIELVENKTTRMYEELMQKYDVSPADLPVLELRKNKELLASFKPMGLWVIGANGRIDILTKSGAYISLKKRNHLFGRCINLTTEKKALISTISLLRNS